MGAAEPVRAGARGHIPPDKRGLAARRTCKEGAQAAAGPALASERRSFGVGAKRTPHAYAPYGYVYNEVGRYSVVTGEALKLGLAISPIFNSET